jgi:DNA-binding LytR/AlgR family response regulator
VAADAVDRVERAGQRTLLRLTDGRHVPVGRSYRPDLKAAGWL